MQIVYCISSQWYIFLLVMVLWNVSFFFVDLGALYISFSHGLEFLSGNPCPSSHQCVDGSCISWSKTCSQIAFCRDGTNAPSVCGK